MIAKKGITAYIYRNEHLSELNRFFGKKQITIIGYQVQGDIPDDCDIPTNWDRLGYQLHEPTDEKPAAIMVYRWIKGKPSHFIKPHIDTRTMFGGSFMHSSDARVSGMNPIYGATPIHDRVE